MPENQTEIYYESLTYYIHNKKNFENNVQNYEKNYYTLKFGLFNKNEKLKKFKGKKYKIYKIGDFKKAQKYSGIINENNLENKLKNLIDQHIPYSFGIWVKFKLKQPYFSRDDEEFYLIQNPILKEKVFKVPMIRRGRWKGVIANAGREIIKENIGKKEFWDYVFSYLRIFGTGNEEFRELINLMKKENKDELKKSLVKYLIFNLNVVIEFDKIEQDWKNIIEEHFDLNFKNIFNDKKNEKKYYEVKKGRAIFYPTYFDRLSLEVINPHSRKTRAGINPIHYEVVPKGSEGILQIVYVPFDGILKKNDELRKEVKKDLEFLCNCIEKVADLGVGAKTKLGWGTFKIKEKIYCLNGNIKIENGELEGWRGCQ
ncbi:hypothetical protein [Methanocaldococcus fervens]|uniref:CRISPR type III-associated protein domain-containing protein n=1 Tax=Methanocaldococcus fervens (strain DSM 4213 / JCM 15782 / AG86) TaxID=573064 RepID=C7P6D2_METFA|nr:hypothetical protein [Methanocaldococcus fervens]ACV24114.1 protein of unknown function DUF324 [Methanocaldococcus fervens AG86]